MNKTFNELFEFSSFLEMIHPVGVLYLLLSLFILYLAKLIFDLTTPFDLNEQLTKQDNKAVAMSFAGYIVGVGIILHGVLSDDSSLVSLSDSQALLMDVLSTIGWGVGGIILLNIARLINDRVLLPKFSINHELIHDRNIGAGAVECGALIGSALIIQAALTGESTSLLTAILGALLYFFLGQICFFLFGFIYQKISRFDLHQEIKDDNPAAGVSFGLNLMAIGILTSAFIKLSDSLIGLSIWFIVSSFMLICCRYLVDKLLLPGELLDEEISQDRNWGAAMVEGFSTIILALIFTAVLF